MSNYLNQIESDLYKLNSITNGSGEVVEMVAELKEKYEKAKAWDKTQDLIKDCTGQFDASGEWDTDWCAFEDGIDGIIDEYESGGYDAKK